MKVNVYCDELYPFYGFNTNTFNEWADSIKEVPKETVDNWTAVMKEFWKIQSEIESYYKKANEQTPV